MRGRLAIGGLVVLGAFVTAYSHYARMLETVLPEGSQVDRIHIRKGARLMDVYAGPEHLGRYRIGIGNGDDGPKTFEGDRRTPEGRYRIDRRHRSPRFHRFLHVSYPNPEDRKRLLQAIEAGSLSKTARSGGSIGIHGVPRWADWIPFAPTLGWTAGCIAVHNREAEELFEAVAKNASVVIDP